MNETVSISRATSLSRPASRHGSTASRSQSLIKKNIAPHDLRPSDILIERFTAWKAIVKQLISYFEGIADIENNVAREMTKLGAVIQVPFRAGNQFLGEGGLQVSSSTPMYFQYALTLCHRTSSMVFVIILVLLPTSTPTWVVRWMGRSFSTCRN